MYEHQKILNNIVKLVDQLPYKSVRIEVEMKDRTIILKKSQRNKASLSNSKYLASKSR